ncbi:MAG TPA: hypothetical protein VMH33_08795 [Solirubrobacterales bacterium]|nr:hypothetical protein [Solirubrobacterales bacterium]
MSENYPLIRQAILDRRQVHAIYKGRFREMCPHFLGSKNGRPQALFFQFAGESESGLPPGGGWRCLPVDRLIDVSVHDGPWHTDAHAGRPPSCIDKVDVEIAD